MNRRQAAGEIALFVAAASAGTVGVGEAFRGHGAWLAVTLVAVFVLARQMGRVQDRWPRRNRPRRPPSGRRAGGRPRASAGEDSRPGSLTQQQMTSGAAGRTADPAERDREPTQ